MGDAGMCCLNCLNSKYVDMSLSEYSYSISSYVMPVNNINIT